MGVRLKLRHIENKPELDPGMIGLNAIVEYDWKLAIGDSTIDYDEFKQLAALKTPGTHQGTG